MNLSMDNCQLGSVMQGYVDGDPRKLYQKLIRYLTAIVLTSDTPNKLNRGRRIEEEDPSNQSQIFWTLWTVVVLVIGVKDLDI